MASVRRVLLAALACGLPALFACVTVEGTLGADGAGTVVMEYPVSPNTTERLERRRFTSSHITIDSFEIRPDRKARVKLSLADAAKLSTAEMFRGVTVTRMRTGEEERLTIRVVNPVSKQIEDDGRPGPKISLTLPGKVLEANRGARFEENRVTWQFSLADYVKDKTTELTARYTVPADATPASSTTTVPPAGPAEKSPAT
jgi:hypothetical protein